MKTKEKHYKLKDIVIGSSLEQRGFFCYVEKNGNSYYEEIPEVGSIGRRFYNIDIYTSLISLVKEQNALPLLMDENMNMLDTVTRSKINEVKEFLEQKRHLSDSILTQINLKGNEYAKVISELLGLNVLANSSGLVYKENVDYVAISANKLIKFRTTLAYLINMELCKGKVTIINSGEELSTIVKKALINSGIQMTPNLLSNTFVFIGDIDGYQYYPIEKEKNYVFTTA